MPQHGIVTLLTDFGTRDHYVGAVKGAILAANPDAQIVDISHDIPPHNTKEAAFTLLGYFNTFPFRTTHLVVVDPGVGSARKPLLIATENYYYVAPDNGVLSYALANEEIERVVEISEEHFLRSPMCPTFHARDIFAPCAGWLSRGADSANFGEQISDFVRWEMPKPKFLSEKLLKGLILHIDRFGNIITNISREKFEEGVGKFPKSKPRIILSTQEITDLVSTYAEGKNSLFFLFGSTGFLEIAARERSAAELLKTEVGKDIGVMFG